MTYGSWVTDYHNRLSGIFSKLNNLSYTREQVISYFDFDNMVKEEPDFCLLYKDNEKCHDIDKLNCLYCGCPHLEYNNNGLYRDNEMLVASECNISAKDSDIFTYGNVKHCDCTNCYLPHISGYIDKRFNGDDDIFKIYKENKDET